MNERFGLIKTIRFYFWKKKNKKAFKKRKFIY